MIFLLRSLSVSYFRRQPGKMLLALAGIAVGVATFVSLRGAQDALTTSFIVSADQLAGHADLQITAVAGICRDSAGVVAGNRVD